MSRRYTLRLKLLIILTEVVNGYNELRLQMIPWIALFILKEERVSIESSEMTEDSSHAALAEPNLNVHRRIRKLWI